jgi:hypothetical protein
MDLVIALWPSMGCMMNKRTIALLSVFALATGFVQAQDKVDEQTFIAYTIKEGDTISKISRKYLLHPVDLEAIKRSNTIQNLDQLTVGAILNIPRNAVKHSPSRAVVMSLSCASPIRLPNSDKLLSVGSALTEGAVIAIPAECHASLLLEDGSIVRLPSGAALKVTTLRKNALESAPEVRFDLTQGRLELDVHKGREKTIPFEVRTPLSIMGVRGTEFRVGYSPENQSGQVEVLGGVVQTRGLADSKSAPVTKGYGVPIDETGKSLGIEKLLDAPVYLNATTTDGNQPAYVVLLQPVPQASYYIADSSATANLTGSRMSQRLLAPEIFIPKLTKQATFYQLTSMSGSGLSGIERQYAFCAATVDTKKARCNALFDVPLADGAPISFALHKAEVHQPIIDTKNLSARNGRFAIQGLPEGQYTWTLSYTMKNTGAADTTIHQSGSFELIAISAKAP